jgi:hypothetical protein
MRDKEAKGRGNHPRGEEHERARLTVADVREIRTAITDGESHRSVARRFGVTHQHVANIHHRRVWRSV